MTGKTKTNKDLINLLSDIRYFEHYNQNGDPCFLCGTHRDEPYILIGIDGTGDGKIEEATPIHLKCMMDNKNWRVRKDMGIIYGRQFEKLI